MPIPMISSRLVAYCCFAATKSGTSSRQGAHHVAQKLHTTTWPRHSSSCRARPSRSTKLAESSRAAPLRDCTTSAPTRAPPAAAAAATPASASALRRAGRIAQERAHFGDARAVHHLSRLRRLQGNALVAGVEHRKLERRPLPLERQDAHGVGAVAGKAPALLGGVRNVAVEEIDLDV